MTTGPHFSARALAVFLACLATAGGVATLTGWAADLPRLTDWDGRGVSQQPNTALAVICCGTALLALVAGRRRLGATLGAVAGLIGGATLLQHLVGIDFGIDRLLLWRDWGRGGTLAPGRMGVPASLSLSLLGGGLVLAAGTRARDVGATMGLIAIVITLLSLTGYAFGADMLFALPRLTTIALQTSLMLLALSLGLLLVLPDVQPTKLLLGDSAAALLMRRALPVVVALPLALGWLRLQGERHGLYDTAFGTAALVLVLIVGLALMSWWAARAVLRHEEAVRHSRAQLQAAVAGMSDGFALYDASWRIGFVNDDMARRFGLTRQELLGRELWTLHPDAVHSAAFTQLQRAMAERIAVDYEVFYPDWQRWFHEKAYPTADGGLALYSREITEHKRQLLLREVQQRALECVASGAGSAECLAPLFDAMPRLSPGMRGCALLADRRGEVFAAALAPPDLRGFADAVVGARIDGLAVGPCGHAPYAREAVTCPDIANDGRWAGEWRALCAAHGIGACHSTPIVGAALGADEAAPDTVYGALMLCFDRPRLPDARELEVGRFASHVCALALERERRELQLHADERQQRALAESLARSEARLRTLVSTVTNLTWIADAAGNFVTPQPAWESFTGQRWPAYRGAAWTEMLHPDDRESVARDWQRALAAGAACHTEGRLWHHSSQAWRRVEVHAVPLRAPDGSVQEWIGACTDVEELRQATAELEQVAARAQSQAADLAALMQAAPVAVWVAQDADCQHISSNPYGYTLLRAPAGSNVSRSAAPAQRVASYRCLRNGVEIPADQLPMQRVGRSGQPVADETIDIVYADGSQRTITVNAVPLLRADGSVRGVLGTGVDISERNRAAQELRDSEQRLQLAMSIGASASWDLDLTTGRSHWSDSHFTLLGLAPTPDRIATARTWASAVLPEDLPAVRAEWARAEAQQDVFRSEHRLRRVDDGRVIWARAAGRFMYDDAGDAIRFLGVWYDITALKEAEQALRDADRLKDQFLATLAHELRNPLAPLRNSLELLRRAGERPELRQRVQATMDRQLNQLVRLVDDLLDVSRITRDRLQLKRAPVTVAEIIQHALEACAPAVLGAGVHLETVLPEMPLHLHADMARLTQVLCNLLTNACKFTDRGGRIRLAAARDGDEVEITVEDNGVGIAADALTAIFDMFTQVEATRARAQGGLGIGLALARRLTEMHGGSLVAHSAGPGRGARFTLRLPLAPPGEAMPAATEPRPTASPRPRRILVVDDNRDAAESLAAMFELDGHEVQTAHDAAQALAAARGFRPEVVVLDIGLPDMDGYAVCRAMRQQAWGPEALMVALTGWGQEEDRRRSREAGFDEHLLKPVDADRLRGLLAGARPG